MKRCLFVLALFFAFTSMSGMAQASCPTGVLHCANLSWSWSQGTGGPATGFNVYRTLSTGGCSTVTATGCTKVNTVAATVKTYTDSPLAASTTYYYVVTAFNTTGESAPSNQVTAATQPDPVPPSPTSLTVTSQ